MRMELTAVFREVPEGGFVAWAEEFPGANTQGETLDEARAMLADAVALMIEAARHRARDFAGEGEPIRETLVITD